MKTPIFIRPLSDPERATLRTGLRSASAVTWRRSQMLRARADGRTARQMARQLGCGDPTGRHVIRAFAAAGGACLTPNSSRPKRIPAESEVSQREHLRELLHPSPRVFGNAHSTWPLDLLADVCVEQGVTQRRQSDDPIRQALPRLPINWQRAQHWITSPDPAYGRKKSSAIASVGSPSSTRPGN